ncbi:MAG: hypothetical protein HY363_06275 [Candidatus Aenigmarchaeota archaeon]|nr:hypothetical protein [Candidatus Aenigmarchaeota archaeon]
MNLIAEFEAFQKTRSLENYLHKSGQKEHVQMAPIFDKYKHILSKNTLKSIKNLTQRENKLLYHSIVLNIINHKVAPASDEACYADASAKVNIDGIELPLRQANAMILNESDAQKRKKIVKTVQKATKQAKTPIELQLRARKAAILSLTGKKYLEYISWVKEVNFKNLAKDAIAILQTSPK